MSISCSAGRRLVQMIAAAAVSFGGWSAPSCGWSQESLPATADPLAAWQQAAVDSGAASAAHWGVQPDKYIQWSSHTNRLVPAYVFGGDLNAFRGPSNPYRDAEKLRRLYGREPAATLNPQAEYFDQTNIYDLQLAAARQGKRHIFLVVFDGLDWQITRAAALIRAGRIAYERGRGEGLLFQDYDQAPTDFGYFVSSPYCDAMKVDVDAQRVLGGAELFGGYDPSQGGAEPWSVPAQAEYLIAGEAGESPRHAYTDSASGATSMTTGYKTYNAAINVGPGGEQLTTLAHLLQREGWAVGAVSSVPISHATPGAAYAHNVTRNDYQDITRDLLGLPSASHPSPLPGMDVVVGGGFGPQADADPRQGENFAAGSKYYADADVLQADVRGGGKYITALRTPGVSGRESLMQAAAQAASSGRRLLAIYGLGAYGGHLPFATANGDYRPVDGKARAEVYSPADLHENPSLQEMSEAALMVLDSTDKKFWLMVEPGDVDWAAHDNNLDNAVGAVYSGEAAVGAIIRWVEKHSSWQESLLVVTADHGHYLNLPHPEKLLK